MRFSRWLAVIFLMAAASSNVVAAGQYRCATEAIRDCSPSGCMELSDRGSIALKVPGWTYRLCRGGDCEDGALDAWSGKPIPDDTGFVGFSQSEKVKGFTGSVDFSRGEFVLIDGSHYWFGRCKAE